jgi:hypothetical protein
MSVSSNLQVDSLTVGGVNVAGALAASEPAFTAVAPLQKGFNLQTGELELRVNGTIDSSPYFCAGLVNGYNLDIKQSRGVSFTVDRNSTYTTRVYKITFATPHPSGDEYIVLVHSRNTNSYLTPAPIALRNWRTGTDAL